MHSLAPEVAALRAAGEIPPAAAERALALEDGARVGVHRELWVVLYAAVATLLAGVGMLVREHLERIGPLTLLAGLVGASAAAYALALRRRPRGLGGDYLLLLGALLLGVAVGYAENRFALFGRQWAWHLLLLALFHGVTAYACNSRLLLGVALTAFAAWCGIGAWTGLDWTIDGGRGPAAVEVGWSALAVAAAYLGARQVHRRAARTRAFEAVYEQYAVNLALAGALALGFAPGTRWLGAALLAALAFAVVRWGLLRRRESFVLYGIGYATFGLVALEAQWVSDTLLASNLGLATIGAAVVLLFKLRARLKDAPP